MISKGRRHQLLGRLGAAGRPQSHGRPRKRFAAQFYAAADVRRSAKPLESSAIRNLGKLISAFAAGASRLARAVRAADRPVVTGFTSGGALCANMRETTLSFFKVEGTESLHDRNGQRKSSKES